MGSDDDETPVCIPRAARERRLSTLTLSVAAIKLSEKVREELEAQIAATLPAEGGPQCWLDVTVSGRSHGGRFAVIVEAVVRPANAPPPDGPEVLRYKLR